MQRVKEENIPGYQGLLIDHLTISKPALNFTIDSILKSKLFTFITETSAEAS